VDVDVDEDEDEDVDVDDDGCVVEQGHDATTAEQVAALSHERLSRLVLADGAHTRIETIIASMS